jgi:hypothetical protein
MNFTHCKFLKKIPDVSRVSNLVSLILDDYVGLVEVHRSVGFLDKLVDLSLAQCSNLRIFLRSLKLRSLKVLVLCGCSRLKNFPKIECQMEHLEFIDFEEFGIEELPISIGYLVGLKHLCLGGCTNLTNLPDSIYHLQHLELLNLNGCTSIKGPPSSIGFLVRVDTLDLGSCTNLMNIPNSIFHLQHLEYLSLEGSKVVKFLKKVEDNRQSMPYTNTSDSNGCSSIAFQKLRQLDLSSCTLS